MQIETTTTYQAKPNALPSAWVDRLFERLAAMYGRAWFDCWADVPMADVKDAWRTILGKFDAESIRRGLERCSTECKFPPSAPEFALLCAGQVQRPEHRPMLSGPKAEIHPELVSRVKELMSNLPKRDKKDWARDILARRDRGERQPFIAVKFAEEALGISADEGME